MSAKSVVLVRDVPVNIAGTRHSELLLKFDHEPSNDEVLEEVHEALSFPLFENDTEREHYLSLCALGAESERGLLEEPKLQLLGEASIHVLVRRMLKDLATPTLIDVVGKKLLATLRDGERHSFGHAAERGDYRWLIAVQTHSGNYKEVASTLRGRHYFRLLSLIEPGNPFASAGVHAILALDYFIEDANPDTKTPFHISLAVSFLPLSAEKIPSEYGCLLIHSELISEEERRALNMESDEGSELNSLLEECWNKSLDLHAAENYQGVVELWKPFLQNPMFRVEHTEWQDKPHSRCRIHSVKSLLFIAFAQLGAAEGSIANALLAFRLLQEVLQVEPYSLDEATPDNLPVGWAKVQNLNYIDTLNFARTWFNGWAGVLESWHGERLPESDLELIPGAELYSAITATERRLAELKSIMSQ